MKKTKNATIIFIILVLISVNLCGCIDPYAAYRYPTAKEAVEASGEYTVDEVYGEEKLNGIICFFYKASKAYGGNEAVSCTLIKNENGYCMVDKYERNTKAAWYDTGNVIMIIYSIKFNKHVIEINFQNRENEPIVTDSIQIILL